MQRRKNHRPRNTFEPLELRCLMAGDIHVEQINGNLFISGDCVGNQLRIHGGYNTGIVTLQAEGDTRLNGVLNGSMTLEYLDSILADFGDGNDSFTLDDCEIRGSVEINMGNGDDSFKSPMTTYMHLPVVVLPAVTSSDLQLAPQGQGSLLPATLAPAERLSSQVLAYSDGNASATQSPIAFAAPVAMDVAGYRRFTRVAQDFVCNLGTGDDYAEIYAGIWGSMSVAAEAGNDEILLALERPNDVTLSAGEGDDEVELTGHIGALNVSVGGGDDTVVLHDLELGSQAPMTTDTPQNLTVELGAGNDTIRQRGVAVSGNELIYAGAGDDVVQSSWIDVYIHTDFPVRVALPSCILTSGTAVGQDLSIFLASGDDVVDFGVMVGGETVIIDDHGDDRIDIDIFNSGKGTVTVNTGDGDDATSIQGSVDQLVLSSAAGNDSVKFADLQANTLNVDLGDGEDVLDIERTTTLVQTDLDGGEGFNTLVEGEGNSLANVRRRRLTPAEPPAV